MKRGKGERDRRVGGERNQGISRKDHKMVWSRVIGGDVDRGNIVKLKM